MTYLMELLLGKSVPHIIPAPCTTFLYRKFVKSLCEVAVNLIRGTSLIE